MGDKSLHYEITEAKRSVTPDRDEIEDRDGVKEITLVTCADYNADWVNRVSEFLKNQQAYSETSEDIFEGL